MAATFTFTDLAAPTTVTATATTGGTLGVDQYYYKVFAIFYDSAASTNTFFEGRSLVSSEVTATTDATNNAVSLTWDAVSGAGGYKVCRATSSGAYMVFLNVAIQDSVVNSGGTCTWVDTGYANATNNAYHNLCHGKITIDRTGTQADDTFGVEDIYDADVAGGWGVITKTGETYDIGTTLIFTNDMTWEDQQKTIKFNDGFTTSKVSMNLGLYDETGAKSYSYNGCSIIFWNYSLNSITFDNLNAYNTTFFQSNEYNSLASRGSLSYLSLSFTAGTIADCYINHLRGFTPSSAINCHYIRTQLFKADIAFSRGAATYEDVTAMDCSRAFQTGSNAVIRAVGYRGIDMSNGDVLCLGSNWDIEFVDSYPTAEPFKYLTGYGVGKIINTATITVLDTEGAAYVGATVNVYNNLGTLEFTGTTNASGQVTDEMIVNSSTWDAAGTLTYVDYNPFSIKIIDEGMRTINTSINVSDKVRETFKIRPQKQIAITQDGVFINADPTDLNDDLSLIKT